MTLLNTWFGSLQLYKSVPWAKDNKVFTIRKPPAWAVTGKAASKMQELQWIHMVLIAHQGKYMKGKITYTNKAGESMSISAPAALVGILRRRTSEIAAGSSEDESLIMAAAGIMARYAMIKDPLNPTQLIFKFKPIVSAEGKNLPNIDAAAAFIRTQIPRAPVLTQAEKDLAFEQKHLQKDQYQDYLKRWEELTDTVLQKSELDEKLPVYPQKKASVFDDFF
ncbi:MAG: hypothetical protein ACFFG0_10705 [Candidatus Thorarchaeota archaeon]